MEFDLTMTAFAVAFVGVTAGAAWYVVSDAVRYVGKLFANKKGKTTVPTRRVGRSNVAIRHIMK